MARNNPPAAGAPAPVTSLADVMQRKRLERARTLHRQVQEDASEAGQVARAAGRRKPLRAAGAFNARRAFDPTTATFSDGRPVTEQYPEAQYQLKWVAEKDGTRDLKQNLQAHQWEGYVPVKDRDGEVIRGIYGMLHAIPNEELADRVITRSPAGGVTPTDYFLAQMEDLVEQANRQHGGAMVKIHRQDDHGNTVSDSLERP